MRRRLLLVALLVGWLCAPSAGDVLASVYSVEEFLRVESKWDTFAEAGVALKVEGRFSSISPALVRFRNCGLPFRAAPGRELPRLGGNQTSVEVSGRLDRENGKLVFLVERLRPVASDLDQFRIRRNQLRPDDADDWYALAAWAAGRSAFYNDDDLRKEADAARLRGVQIERRTIRTDEAHALLALADKAAEFGLDDVRQQFVHEAWLWRWERRPKDQTGREKLARQMAEALPGAETPLDALDPHWEKRYRDAPQTTYQAADADQRKQIHRLLYGRLMLEIIEAEARTDGSNGFAVAARIEEHLPERAAVAERHRGRELAWRLGRVGTLTRDEMLRLAEQFRHRDRPEQADQAVRTWLQVREERLRRDGPVGLMRVAREYLDLLDERQTAAGLLIEAYRLAPGLDEVSDELRRLGYRRRGGQWLDEQQLEALPPDPIAQAIREGRVTAGMTPDQVRRTLGAPADVVRIATAGQIEEVWTWSPPGTSRLAVRFVRRGQQPIRVDSVWQVPVR